MTRRPLGFELSLVVLIAGALLLPNLSGYSLVDPWETHYGEVGRMMLQEHDLVHMHWPGTNDGGDLDEGFRSKPVLTFWLIAAGLRTVGVAADGGYSGELISTPRTMLGLRLPFVLCGIFGLAMMWWMLARLVSRRVAWLALLVVGTSPVYCLIARQAIPDMPLVATTMGALSLFGLALEDGERPIPGLWRLRLGQRFLSIDARHVTLALVGGMVVWQAIYYVVYFLSGAQLAVRTLVSPAVMLPILMGALLLGLSSRPWAWLRRGLVVHRWPGGIRKVGEHMLGMAPLRTMRQLYLLGCYSLLGVGVLAKGPPGLAMVGLVGVLHLVIRRDWRNFYDGKFELKRGLLLLVATALPWHLAMFFTDGIQFIDQYLMIHILDRAGADPDHSLGTFEYYTSQIGHGMWLWAGLLPAAVAAMLLRTRTDSREHRTRMLVGLWAIAGFFIFGIVQTKFHHYILPAVPAFGILVAFLLDDILAGRERLHPLFALIGVGIVLLVCRDLMWEPGRWIDMFVFGYKRLWPAGDPWFVDPSDGFLALGGAAAFAIALTATRWRRAGVAALGASGLAIAVWCVHVYMPIAGTHWGMREAVATYYKDRTIYGQKLAYFGLGQVIDDWRDSGNTRSFDTFLPDGLQVGQPMTITVELHKLEDDKMIDKTLELVGSVSRLGEHTVEVALAPGARATVDALIATYPSEQKRLQAVVEAAEKARDAAKDNKTRGEADGRLHRAREQQHALAHGTRSVVRVVDADRLLAWQLYWRGENFWSQEEIWGYLPEMKTSFPNQANTVEFTKYLADRTRAPLGRRYFILADTPRISSPKSMLPTARARDSYEVLDTTSNKFGLAAFYM